MQEHTEDAKVEEKLAKLPVSPILHHMMLFKIDLIGQNCHLC
jgi:hypothetical protein